MATQEPQANSGNVIPLNRHSTSEPARPTAQAADVVEEPTELMVQENRHSTSEPAE